MTKMMGLESLEIKVLEPEKGFFYVSVAGEEGRKRDTGFRAIRSR